MKQVYIGRQNGGNWVYVVFTPFTRGPHYSVRMKFAAAVTAAV